MQIKISIYLVVLDHKFKLHINLHKIKNKSNKNFTVFLCILIKLLHLHCKKTSLSKIKKSLKFKMLLICPTCPLRFIL